MPFTAAKKGIDSALMVSVKRNGHSSMYVPMQIASAFFMAAQVKKTWSVPARSLGIWVELSFGFSYPFGSELWFLLLRLAPVYPLYGSLAQNG
eukprot:826873-Amphidinium_carterae.1